MAMDANIRGLTGTQAEVDSANNLKVVPSAALPTAPFHVLGGELSSATDPAGVVRKRAWISAEGRLHTAVDRPALYVNFGGSATAANAIPQDVLKQTATTMTADAGSTTGGFLRLNAGGITTITTGIQYQTYATFPTYGGFGTIYEWTAKTLNVNGTANKVVELGVGYTTDAKTAGLLDGFGFRWTATNTFIGFMTINGSEFATDGAGGRPAPMTMPSDGVVHRFTIRSMQDGLYFFVDQVLQCVLSVPSDQAGPGLQPNLPMLVRIYNTGSAPSVAPQLLISELWVIQAGIDWGKPWSHIVAGMGQHCVNVPYGQAMAAAGSATNNRSGTAGGAAVPATAVGTNTGTTLPFTGLGGIGRMTAQATNIAAAGDMIFCSYLVPAQSATQASKRLHITGVSIAASNGGAVIATTPTCLVWSLAWGHTALSLATGDSASAKGPRFLVLGQMYGAIGAVIGQGYDKDIVRQFQTPIVVNPGEYIAVTVRFLLGTATASQEVVGVIGFEGYWE
jgi:hypothetical protein